MAPNSCNSVHGFSHCSSSCVSNQIVTLFQMSTRWTRCTRCAFRWERPPRCSSCSSSSTPCSCCSPSAQQVSGLGDGGFGYNVGLLLVSESILSVLPTQGYVNRKQKQNKNRGRLREKTKFYVFIWLVNDQVRYKYIPTWRNFQLR